MNAKKIVRMPLRRVPQRTRPPASTLRARAAVADPEEEDYGAEEEPNMRFSHALAVVLALHVIAVGGIFAFNSLKTHNDGKLTKPVAAATAASEPAAEAAKPAPEATPWKGRTHVVKAGDTLTHVASQYGTTVAALGEANEITSYSMLRVGQTLRIPGDSSASKPAPVAARKPDPTEAAAKQAFLATKTGESTGTIRAVATKPAEPAPARPDIIETPEKAVIAAAPPKSAASATPIAADAAVPPADGVYVVVKGDNPYSLAKKFHVSYKSLLAANNITDPTKMQIGQKLKIPKD